MENIEQPTVNPETSVVAEDFPFRKALKETAAERTALRQEELVRMTFDISLAIEMVMAAVPRIERFREEIAQLPIDHAFIARLDVYMGAASYAHARCNRANTPEELRPIYENAVERRATMFSDASNLVRHRKLAEDSLNKIRNETGFRNVAYDLMTLVDLYRDSEERIAGHTATKPEELDQAERIATQLLKVAARRDDGQATQPGLRESRWRAVSLMIKCYQEARRAIQFLRFHHGDAEVIAPSVYTARSSSKRDESTDDDLELAPPAVLPAGTQAGQAATGLATTGQPATGQAAVQPLAAQHEEPEYPVVPIGAPGGNPFA